MKNINGIYAKTLSGLWLLIAKQKETKCLEKLCHAMTVCATVCYTIIGKVPPESGLVSGLLQFVLHYGNKAKHLFQ